MRRNRSLWEEVVRRVREREMPPKKFPQLTTEAREALIKWVEQEVLAFPATEAPPRFMARRLQRNEYANSIRDLLGIRYLPGADFPKDQMAFRPGDDINELTAELAGDYKSAAQAILKNASRVDAQVCGRK